MTRQTDRHTNPSNDTASIALFFRSATRTWKLGGSKTRPPKSSSGELKTISGSLVSSLSFISRRYKPPSKSSDIHQMYLGLMKDISHWVMIIRGIICWICWCVSYCYPLEIMVNKRVLWKPVIHFIFHIFLVSVSNTTLSYLPHSLFLPT